MTAAVFLWGGLALVVLAVWVVAGPTVGGLALGVFGLLAASTGLAAMRPPRDRSPS